MPRGNSAHRHKFRYDPFCSRGAKQVLIRAVGPSLRTYTVHVSGVGETTGEALVEIYDVW